jgi:hypothetical protein
MITFTGYRNEGKNMYWSIQYDDMFYQGLISKEDLKKIKTHTRMRNPRVQEGGLSCRIPLKHLKYEDLELIDDNRLQEINRCIEQKSNNTFDIMSLLVD